ncbi:hypothetical protein ACJMK2_040215 [Sinanodonta woodiana]|uniref:G-protein coupled receptors family 1 profile domain-containing protein n=1 Tax=Sinanodonta woodiana TaxID=1069815 RepID=A0ABD3WFC4_SINWO
MSLEKYQSPPDHEHIVSSSSEHTWRNFVDPELLSKHQNMSSLYDNQYSFPNFNFSDWLYDQFELPEIAEQRILPIIFCVTFVIGLTGNGLVLYVFVRNKSMRTVTNFYLINLAIGDSLYLFTCVPATSVMYWRDAWPFGEIMCKMTSYMMGVTMTISVFTLTALGIDRHNAILYPVKSKPYRTLPKTVFIIACIWIAALVVNSPALVISRQVTYWTYPEGSKHTCLNHWRDSWHKIYSLSMFIFLYAIPQVILGFCYFRIAKKLWLSMRRNVRMNQVTVHTLKTRRRVVKLVFIVTSAFAVCWLPVHIAELCSAFGMSLNHTFYEFKVVTPFLPYLLIAVNPIIYCFMSKGFRNHFKAAFTCRKVSSNSNEWMEDPNYVPVPVRHHRQDSPRETSCRLRSEPSHDADTNMRMDTGVSAQTRGCQTEIQAVQIAYDRRSMPMSNSAPTPI